MEFEDLETYKTTIDNFPLKWRFDSKNDEEYEDLDKNLTILNKKGSEKVAVFLESRELHSDFPFKKGLFSINSHFSIAGYNDIEIKAELDTLRIDDTKQILLTWDNETSVLTNWGFLKNHHSDFFYPSSDDLTVMDENMLWTILFHHSEIIYFSTNKLTQNE